jgi:hypothetical protein
VLAVCSGAAGTSSSDATRTALNDLAVQISIPDHALFQLTDEDIEYAEELVQLRTLTERSAISWDCYSDTLVQGIRYYRDVIDLPTHSLELDIPLGWITNMIIDGDTRLLRLAETREGSVTIMWMVQNCEPVDLVDHPRQGGTHVSIIS